MKLTTEDVRRLSTLAQMEMTESEVESFRGDADAILGYVERLKTVDTDGVDPHGSPSKGEGEWRPDVVVPCTEAVMTEIVKRFPEREGDLLRTPGIFERPKKEKPI